MTESTTTGAAPEFDSAAAAEMIADGAWDNKAMHLRVLDVQRIVSYADYLVICHGTSERHGNAIAESIMREMRPTKYRPIGIEGKSGGDWTLLDFGDVVVHIFSSAEARREYNLDSMYSDAPRYPVATPPELEDDDAMRAPQRASQFVPSVDDFDDLDDL